MYEQPILWLKNLFVPLWHAELPEFSRVAQGAEEALAHTDTLAGLLVLVTVLLVLVWQLRSPLAVLGQAVYLLPFFGFTLGLITIGEAVFVFAMELVVYFGLHLLSTLYEILTPSRQALKPADAEPSGGLGAFLIGGLATLLLTGFLGVVTLVGIFFSIQGAGMIEFEDRLARAPTPYTDANYRAHHDDLMRLKHQCLALPEPSDALLKAAADQTLKRYSDPKSQASLRGAWQREILWGDCTVPMRTQAPWFVLLCLMALLIKEALHSVTLRESTPNGVLPAMLLFVTLRIVFITLVPAWLCDSFWGTEHMALTLIITLAVQRLIMGTILAPDTEPGEVQLPS